MLNVNGWDLGQDGKPVKASRTFRAHSCFLRVVSILYTIQPMYSKEDLSKAISAYNNNQYSSIRKCADAFKIPFSTLRDRLSGGTSRPIAHEHQQYLSIPEEETLIKWISRLYKQGCPISPSLARKLAFEIRVNRDALTTPLPLPRLPSTK
jgi:hypothetical protein